jgi:predicted regulator of Ras-like GTPase activity (Roadblock/LC7/MglB family)
MPTTVSHEALESVDTLAIVAQMADRPPSGGPSVADAEVAVARLQAMSADLRGCAIVGPDGGVFAASGDSAAWSDAATGVIAAADTAAGEPVTHAHVGTEDGEVFVVRDQGYVLVAAADRFALAGLMVFDIRAALRDLVRGPDAAPVRDAEPEAA